METNAVSALTIKSVYPGIFYYDIYPVLAPGNSNLGVSDIRPVISCIMLSQHSYLVYRRPCGWAISSTLNNMGNGDNNYGALTDAFPFPFSEIVTAMCVQS